MSWKMTCVNVICLSPIWETKKLTPLTYNKVTEYINKKVTDESDEYWQLQKILSIQHTPPNHKDQLGSEYNAKMLWETGDITNEPLDFLAKDILLFSYFQGDVKMIWETDEVTYEPLPFLAKDILSVFYYEGYTRHLFEDDSLYFNCYTKSFMLMTMN